MATAMWRPARSRSRSTTTCRKEQRQLRQHLQQWVDCPADDGVNFGQVDEDMLAAGNHDTDNPNRIVSPDSDSDPTGATTGAASK